MAFYRAVNHQLKLIGYFSPKCGCTTLKRWFASQDRIPENATHIPKRLRKDWTSYELVTHEYYNDFTKVFFVRSPLDRLVSFYGSFVVRERTAPGEKWHFADDAKKRDLRGMSFRQFMDEVLRTHESEDEALQHHLEHQTAGTDNVVLDVVIKLDQLAEGIEALGRVLDAELPHPTIENASLYDPSLTGKAWDTIPEVHRYSGMPEPRYFFNDELVSVARRVYDHDFAIYEEAATHFPGRRC